MEPRIIRMTAMAGHLFARARNSSSVMPSRKSRPCADLEFHFSQPAFELLFDLFEALRALEQLLPLRGDRPQIYQELPVLLG